MVTEKVGTRNYWLSRLERDRPDLFKKVKRGELSVNAAVIAANWRKKPIQVEINLRNIERILTILDDILKLQQELINLGSSQSNHKSKKKYNSLVITTKKGDIWTSTQVNSLLDKLTKEFDKK